MSYKSLLLHLDGGARDEAALGVALHVAQREEAHLTLLHVIHPFTAALGAFGGAAPSVMADIERQYIDDARAAAKGLREMAEERASRAGIPCEWRLEEGLADDIVPRHARYADLTVANQIDPESLDSPRKRGLAVNLVMQSGKPMLLVPYAGDFSAPGKRILVAWNGSREAARAVGDAMPFLRRADLVSVLSINPKNGGHIAGYDISNLIARHGARTQAVRTVSGDVSVGDLLLSEAADLDADMIVMGAYGRSRLRELVLGGASRQVLESMTVPIFMSH
jgi:nucleotide-binding universal stress UspA family protein